METDKNPSNGPVDAPKLLEELRADRGTLADRMRAPWWLAPGFGVVAAAYVAVPLFPDDQRTFLFLAVVAVSIALAGSYPRVTGVKASGLRPVEWGLTAAGLVGTLLLLSVSFGLVAADLRWWVAAPAFAAFALVTWLAGKLTASARERVRRGY